LTEIIGEDVIQLHHLEALFDAFDTNKNELIDFSEFQMLGKYISKSNHDSLKKGPVEFLVRAIITIFQVKYYAINQR